MILKDFLKQAVVFAEVYTGNGHYAIDDIQLHNEFDELMNRVVRDTDDADLKYLRDTEDGLWVLAREDESKCWILTKVK